MKDFYLSLDTAKQLKEWGCNLETDYYICDFERDSIVVNAMNIDMEELQENLGRFMGKTKTYHILEDICVKNMYDFFGEEVPKTLDICKNILNLLQQYRKEEAEQYILDNCIFNPDNQ